MKPRANWITPIYLSLLFLLAHVAAPWGLSMLAAHHGWMNGFPGLWNSLGLIVVVIGIASTFWMIALHFRASPQAFLELKETQKVLTRGPYAFSRNPMYLSELVFWLGWALFYGSIPVLAGFLLLFAGFNFVAVPWEERHLESQFGEPYRAYKTRCSRWFGFPHSP